ncbi:pentatricopeptide repeat-containing protein At1g76280-like [Prunus persica]|uniref:pentatricopeptide repeat-containing protein At1g76280-like n=1 Tax=Prunus persica TaxID=3760 RepID=UPI0009AB6151|nr:pentatricopeptide repeat-containing protein At1g76280-like [Prunus persica]
MHQEKVQPDPATCHFVFSAYANSGFHSTAMEALQVLSMRMICEEDGSFPEKAEFEDDFIFAEDLEAESRIVQLFKDSEEKLAVALLNLRWCAVLGFPISWSSNQSPFEDCHLTTLPGGIMTPVSFPLLLFLVVVERSVRPPQEEGVRGTDEVLIFYR